MAEALLKIEGLDVRFNTPEGEVAAVNQLSFSLADADTLAIVGESGSGKSQSVLSLLGLQAPNGRVRGSARFRGQELLGLEERELNRVRGARIAMVFQDPMTSLNPYLSIGVQMTEVLQVHKGLGAAQARARAIDMLNAVRIPDAARRLNRYPHEFSGGMRQRVMIATALLCEPALLIADEPTTALDVTVQADILALLRELRQRFNMALILITHDLGVAASVCDTLLVMYAGRAVEYGRLAQIRQQPRHPYTEALLRAVPRIDLPRAAGLRVIPGDPPNPLAPPSGCAFHPRCPYRMEKCQLINPPLTRADTDWLKACHLDTLGGAR